MTRAERDRPAALAASEASQAAIKLENAKHTPGPWYALRGQRNISIRHKTGDKFLPMVNVASVRGNFPTDCPYGSSEANARLIAAAPELLEALQFMLTEFEHGDINAGEEAAISKARAAIQKATGEPE